MKAVAYFLPVGSKRRKVVKRFFIIFSQIDYKAKQIALEKIWARTTFKKYSYLRNFFQTSWFPEDEDQEFRKLEKSLDIIIPTFNASADVILLLNDISSELQSSGNDSWTKVNVLVADDRSEESEWFNIKVEAEKFGFSVTRQKNNQGFLKNINYAFAKSSADFVLVLNSDVRLPAGFLKKLARQVYLDDFTLLTVPSFEDLIDWGIDSPNWYLLNESLEDFGALSMNACTAVGYCLLIKREDITLPLFDTKFGHGYGEDSDLHYRVVSSGLNSKLCLSMCVSHIGGRSYANYPGTKDEKVQAKRLFNRRWEARYSLEFAFFVESFASTFSSLQNRGINETIFFAIPGLGSKGIGGLRILEDCARELVGDFKNISIINLTGENPEIAYGGVKTLIKSDFHEVKSIHKLVIAGIDGALFLDSLEKKSIQIGSLINIVQGPDMLMDPRWTSKFFSSITRSDKVLTNSEYVEKIVNLVAGKESIQFTPEISSSLAISQIDKYCEPSDLLISIRGEHGKANWLSVAVANYFVTKGKKVTAVGNSEADLGLDQKVNRIGVVSAEKLYGVLHNSKVFFDSSLYEGYGLLPRESLSQATRVVAVRNGGNNNLENLESFRLVEPWDFVKIVKDIEHFMSLEKMEDSYSFSAGTSLKQALETII